MKHLVLVSLFCLTAYPSQHDCRRQCHFKSFLSPNDSATAEYLDNLPSSTELDFASELYQNAVSTINGLVWITQNAQGRTAEEVYKMLAPKSSKPSEEEIHAFKVAFDTFRTLEKKIANYLQTGKPANSKEELCSLQKGFDAACSLYEQIMQLRAKR